MHRHAPFLLAPLLLWTGCGEAGSFELRWSISCETGKPAACPVKTAKDCADAGFDAVQVVAVRDNERTRALFPCFGNGGPVGRGPGLDEGPTTLEVSALSPGGQQLSGPVSVAATVPGSGLVPVEVTLPRPPACGDGTDNDGDGLVDLLDPECTGQTDPQE